jgi:hypothetical protein
LLGRPAVSFSLAALVSSGNSWDSSRDVDSIGSFFITGLSDVQV